MTDRELLELAAKAAGYHKEDVSIYDDLSEIRDGNGNWRHWNPLTDDGDALRLAVKIGISTGGLSIFFADKYDNSVIVRNDGNAQELDEFDANDPYAATRRAIVRAAAEIGKAI